MIVDHIIGKWLWVIVEHNNVIGLYSGYILSQQSFRDIRGREMPTNQYKYVYYDNFNDGRSSRRCLDGRNSNNRYHSGLFDPNANHEVSDRGDFRDHSRYY